MPTHTQIDKVLTLTLPAGLCGNPVDIACQLPSASYTVSTPASIESTQVACGGDPVVEGSAERTPGTINFDAFKDTSGTGITTLMMLAAHYGVPVDFQYTENPGDHAISWTSKGKATFDASEVGFTPSQTGKHNVTMQVQSEHLLMAGQVELTGTFGSLAALQADQTEGDGNYSGAAMTTGQYVVLGDGSCAHYATGAWVAGAAS